jgi:hypothetical protein
MQELREEIRSAAGMGIQGRKVAWEILVVLFVALPAGIQEQQECAALPEHEEVTGIWRRLTRTVEAGEFITSARNVAALFHIRLKSVHIALNR